MIRPATKDDLQALVDMAQSLVKESPVFDVMTFRREKTFNFLYSLIEQHDGILIVAESQTEYVGAMAGAVAEHPFSYEKFAFDYGLFVYPGFRSSIYAHRLVKAFERRASELGAQDFRPGIMTAVQISRTTDFYERMGYRQTGTQLIKVL